MVRNRCPCRIHSLRHIVYIGKPKEKIIESVQRDVEGVSVMGLYNNGFHEYGMYKMYELRVREAESYWKRMWTLFT